ncbi:MAG: hypothetical protein ASARMPRED_006247 [Alectoria sarmentosa]|nr:MAG: hypothetical protein ASARMPRED_006247 [Alectoria sarmentosa]
MCERCTIIECAFGSRDPLPPRIASLDADYHNPPAIEVEEAKPKGVHHNRANHLGSPGDTTPALQTSASTSSGTCNSALVILQRGEAVGPSATTAAAPASAPSAHVKWSDVVDLGSEAFQPRAISSPGDFAVAMPYSILLTITKNADILDALLLNCPDFATLFALVASCHTAKNAFERHPQGIIKAMLGRMPQELQYLTVALIGMNGTQVGDSESIKTLMETWLGMGPKPLTERLQKDPVEIIRKLALSFNAIDLFMEVIPRNCVNNFTDYKTVMVSREGLEYLHVTQLSNKHPLLEQTEWSDIPDDTEWEVPGLPTPETGPQEIALPLSDGETYRLKRALLRYELFCALFYLGPDRQKAFREEQIIFLKEYVNPWEIGELAVVTHFMYDLVRNAYFHKYKTLRYDEAYESWYGRSGNRFHGRNRHTDHEKVADEFDNHVVWFTSQGLSLLQRIYYDRKAGYAALMEKHCVPRYRLAEIFVPFEECANRREYGFESDEKSVWKPRKLWPDTPGMELPSKGWLAKSPATDTRENTAYWGEKWMRKIGYFIWDRD